jgi:pilus assembly protein CpaB
MGRRTILLVASVVVAALGTFLVFMYANKAQTAAAAGQQPVEVLVAKDAIPAGSSGAVIQSSGDVELRTLPQASVPENALSDLGGVQSLLNATPIYAGQVLIADMFTGADKTTALTLPKGTMAMSVELKDPQRVAGFVTPGSEVAIFATADLSGEQSTTGTLVDRVRVVAVGPSTLRPAGEEKGKTTNSEEIPTAILTVAVTEDQAKKLAYGASEADLHMALLDPNSKVSGGSPLNGSDIFEG